MWYNINIQKIFWDKFDKLLEELYSKQKIKIKPIKKQNFSAHIL